MPEDRAQIVKDIGLNTSQRIADAVNRALDLMDGDNEQLLLLTLVMVTAGDQYIKSLQSILPDLDLDSLSERDRFLSVYSALSHLSCPDGGTKDFDVRVIQRATGDLIETIDASRLELGMLHPHEKETTQ